MTEYMPETPERYGFGATPDPDGHFCMWSQVEYALARAGGVQWYPPEEKPAQGEQVLGEWEPDIYRMYYVDDSGVWREIDMQGRQRPNSTTEPIRWMRIPTQAVTPPSTPAPGDGVHIDAIAGQQLVDILKRSFTTARIQDLIDASPYDEPDVGAPLS